MLVYRIARREYINDLSGTGAALFGGRWNPKGLPLLYTAGNISLAYIEFLVHNYHILNTTEVCLAIIEIKKDESVATINISDLPSAWNKQPAFNSLTQNIGKEFIKEKKSYILKAPSACVPGEFNFLLNPLHKQHHFTKVKQVIDPFKFDERLIQYVQTLP